MEKSSPQTPTENPLGPANQLRKCAIGGNPRTSRQDVARDVRICAGCGWADIHINPCVSRLKRERTEVSPTKTVAWMVGLERGKTPFRSLALRSRGRVAGSDVRVVISWGEMRP